MVAYRLCLSCTVLSVAIFDAALADRAVASDYDSPDLAYRSHRLADVSRIDSEPEAEQSNMGVEDEDQDQGEAERQRRIEALEVRVVGFKRRVGKEATSSQRREGALEHQLEVAQQQRGEAEEFERAAEHEAEHAHDLLIAAKKQLAAESEDNADLRVAANEAMRQASRAKREAVLAKRGASAERTQARRAVAAVAGANEMAEEAALDRKEARLRETRAEEEQSKAEELRERYEDKFENAKIAKSLAERQRRQSIANERKERAALLRQQWWAATAVKAAKREKRDAREQRNKHFKAASAMRQETEQAAAVLEQAGRAKAAAQREKARAMLVKRQAVMGVQNAYTLSFVSWGLLAIVLVGVLGFSTEIHKMEAASLRPALLLGHLRGCLTPRNPAKWIATKVPSPTLPDPETETLAQPAPEALAMPSPAQTQLCGEDDYGY